SSRRRQRITSWCCSGTGSSSRPRSSKRPRLPAVPQTTTGPVVATVSWNPFMDTSGYRISLLYDDGGYVETVRPQPGAAPGSPAGLMGRQVAGKEFLDAFLHHGRWE